MHSFRGESPRTSKRLLADNKAQLATNCKLTSGRIDPYKGLLLSSTTGITDTIKTAYRYRFGDVYNWLVFGAVVDVAKSPVLQDTLGRFYMTGDGEPHMSTYADAIQGAYYPNTSYVLGVFAPTSAATIAVVGGVGSNESRAYVYTFKTRYGEESGPSPATLFTGKTDGSWNLTGMTAKPPNSGYVTAAVKDTPSSGYVTATLDTVVGLSDGEKVTFGAVVGMTDLNASFLIKSIDTALGKVVVQLATTQTYTSGGTWARNYTHNTTSMTKVIYRTVGTGTDYKFVAEIDGALTSYSDIIPAATVSLNSGITVLNTLPPLKNLHSLVLLANGVLAGLSGGQLCLSDQSKPYSWPLSNRYSFPGAGVALVAAGNAAIIMTDGYPCVASATIPELATISKIAGDTHAPCLSKRGVVDIGSGALYPSNDGLYVATSSGVQNITADLYTYTEWVRLMPRTFSAAYQDSRYYAFHDADESEPNLFVIHTKERDSIVQVNERGDAIYSNPYDGRLYVAKESQIYLWDEDDANRYASFWKSKEYQLAKPLNFSFAQVQANFDEIVPLSTLIQDANNALMLAANDINGEILGQEILDLEIAGSELELVPEVTANAVQFTLLMNDYPVFSKSLTSSRPFRLPSGKKTDIYAVQITSSVSVYSINMAQGAAELSQAPV